MSFLKNLFKNYSFLLIFSVILFCFFLISNVFSWSYPTDNPPNANLPSPINTSSQEQTKSGNLILENDLTVGGLLRVGLFSSHPTGTNGALYYNTQDHKFYGYQNDSWQELGSGSGGIWSVNGNDIYYTNGNVGIGTNSPTEKLTVSATSTITSGLQSLSRFEMNVDPSGDSTATYYSNWARIIIPSTNSWNFPVGSILNPWFSETVQNGSGNVDWMIGIYARAQHNGSGTVSDMYGVVGDAKHTGSGTVTNANAVRSYVRSYQGTITNGYGFYARGRGYDPGVITNFYGFYLEEDVTGVTNPYGVYIAASAAKNYFAGNVGIGTTSPDGDVKLEVAGAIKSSTTNYNYYYVIDLTPFDANTWYPVVLDGNIGEPVKFEIIRHSVHEDGSWYGTVHFVGIFNGIQWGNTSGQWQYKYEESGATDLISWVGQQSHGNDIIIYLRGDRKYYLKSSRKVLNLSSLGNTYCDPSGGGNYYYCVYPDTTPADPPSYTNDPNAQYPEGITWRDVKGGTSMAVSGNVGIGTTDPGSYKLYVNGTAYSTGGWQSSDIRLKEVLQDNIPHALEKILQLKGITFRWKTKDFPNKGLPEGIHFGIPAQDAEKILPEIVREDNEGYKAISYQELIPVLIEAIKEQNNQIQQLQKEVELLKNSK